MNNEFKESKDLFKKAISSFNNALMHVGKIALITCFKYIKEHKVFDTIVVGLMIYIIMIGQIISYHSKEQSVSSTIMHLNDTIYSLRQDNEFMREKNIILNQRLNALSVSIKQSHQFKKNYGYHYKHFNKLRKDSI